MFASCYSQAVETESFTIEFQEHVPMHNREVWLNRLKNRGARIERQGDQIFRVHCATRKDVRRAGYFLLWPMGSICSVIETTGIAEARASAYQYHWETSAKRRTWGMKRILTRFGITSGLAVIHSEPYYVAFGLGGPGKQIWIWKNTSARCHLRCCWQRF